MNLNAASLHDHRLARGRELPAGSANGSFELSSFVFGQSWLEPVVIRRT